MLGVLSALCLCLQVLTSVFPVSEMDTESREMTQQLLQQLDKFRE